MGVLLVFRRQIHSGYEYVAENTKRVLGFRTHPEVTAAIYPEMHDPTANVTVPPVAPQTVTPAQERLPQPTQTSIVEKILPSTKNEVFNVAQNKFTYYDAEPLCNALGAELATYEQVKNAWENGADWCNYGWVKGQMAVYPTQKDTYEKLQAGPEDQRMACGNPGLNGGFFDNPEMKFGVNCYGQKPSQSAHDANAVAKGTPQSPDALQFDKKVAHYKSEADNIGVMPFSTNKWSN